MMEAAAIPLYSMQDKHWKDLTLGECAQLAKLKARQTRRFVKRYSPIKVDLVALGNIWEAVAPHILAPILYLLQPSEPQQLPPGVESQSALAPAKNRPWYRRTAKLEAVLAEAWEQGIQSYSKLLAYVKQSTGKGCSKRAIARFKRERGLI